MFTVRATKNNNTLSGCGCGVPTVQPMRGLGAIASGVQNEANTYCVDLLGSKGDETSVGQCNVWYTGNKNANGSFPGSKWNPIRWAGIRLYQSYSLDDVANVINKYIAAAKQGEAVCPEYARPTDKNRAKSNLVIQKLKVYLPKYEENFLRVVMYELEQDVKAGIAAPNLLWPNSITDLNNVPSEFKDTLNTYVKQIQEDEKKRNKPDLLEEILQYLKYTLIISGVAGAAYVGFKVYSAVKP